MSGAYAPKTLRGSRGLSLPVEVNYKNHIINLPNYQLLPAAFCLVKVTDRTNDVIPNARQERALSSARE
jgi:hypothetical protein